MRRFLLAFGLWLGLAHGAHAYTCVTLGAQTASTVGTDTVGGLNSKGSWVEFTSSLSITAKHLWVFYRPQDNSTWLIDIGTGAASSEVVLIPNLAIDYKIISSGSAVGPIPTSIASGTRVVARSEADSTASGNETVDLVMLLCDEGIPELTSYTYATYGANAGSDVKGTVVDPGASANTKGSYVQITASAQASLEHLTIHIGSGQAGTTLTGTWLIDVAIGSAGAESVVLSDLYITNAAAGDIFEPRTIRLPGENFAGQRIAVRAQSSLTSSPERTLTVVAVTAAGSVVTGGGGGGVMPMGGLIKK